MPKYDPSIKNEILEFWNVNVNNFENKEKLKGESKLKRLNDISIQDAYGPSLTKQLVYLKGITFNNLWIINFKVI